MSELTYEFIKQTLAGLEPTDEQGREHFIQWDKEEKSGSFTNRGEIRDAQSVLDHVWTLLIAAGMTFGIPISHSVSKNGLGFQYEHPINGKGWIQIFRIGQNEYLLHGYLD